MTNWQDKYKDLEIGQSAWYWHGQDGEWVPYRVFCVKTNNAVEYWWGTPPRHRVIKEFPNGPKCITPDEMIENSTEELDKDLPPDCYDTCANCGFWHYTHANSSCKNFVKK